MLDLSPEALQRILLEVIVVGFVLMTIEDSQILVPTAIFAGYVAIMKLLGS